MQTAFAARTAIAGGLACRRSASDAAFKAHRVTIGVSRRAQVSVSAFFGGAQKGEPQGNKGNNFYPEVYSQPTTTAGGDLTTEQREMLQLGTALRNIGWLSFWGQLILTTVSGVILLFSTGVTSKGALSISPIDVFTFFGVAAGLITSALSWSWIRAGRRLGFLQEVKLQQVMATVLASTNLNLVGMGAAILGLQATTGGLVAKTLTAATAYYGPRSAPPPVAFDVFSVQACGNTIMAHFVGMVLAQWLLRTVSRYMQRQEEREVMPSAPPFAA